MTNDSFYNICDVKLIEAVPVITIIMFQEFQKEFITFKFQVK